MEEQAPTKRHIACGICRRRKLKCDGKKPTCSTCQRLNQVCEYSDVIRKAGPKRGYVRVLEGRVAQLEKLLNDYNINENDPASVDSLVSLEVEEQLPSIEVINELSERFFNRFNMLMPVVDRKRYMLSLGMSPQYRPKPYIQYAIMATAAADWPKFKSMKQALFERARKYLQKAELNFGTYNLPSVHYVIALGLVAHLELREGHIHSAWISIGKAYKACLMMGLHLMDKDTWTSTTRDTVAQAEARRAFWFSYFSERAGSCAAELPSVINPDSVFTKLPMDDEAFLAGTQAAYECFSVEEIMKNPRITNSSSRLALTTCLVECAYQLGDLGRFPNKKFQDSPESWMRMYTQYDTILNRMIAHIPPIPPIPQDSHENKIILEEKSRRCSYLMIHLWAQAAILYAARSGLMGVQQQPMLMSMANPAKMVQRSLMAMLEVLLMTRNPHDITVVNIHPLHPILLFSFAFVIGVLSEIGLVSLDNFKAPLEYICSTMQELEESIPICHRFVEFIYRLFPQLQSADGSQNVNRVEDALAAGVLNLVLPNFFDNFDDRVADIKNSSKIQALTSPGASPNDIVSPTGSHRSNTKQTPGSRKSDSSPNSNSDDSPLLNQPFNVHVHQQVSPGQMPSREMPSHAMHHHVHGGPQSDLTMAEAPGPILDTFEFDFSADTIDPHQPYGGDPSPVGNTSDALLGFEPPIYIPNIKQEDTLDFGANSPWLEAHAFDGRTGWQGV